MIIKVTLSRPGLRIAAMLVAICLITQKNYAQLGTLNTISQPIAPDVASLGKFVEMPVSNYSGLADIRVPLYTLMSSKLNFPLSLSYHSSGVKVRDIPGTVGSGWALNAGGAITRVIRGVRDEIGIDYKPVLETIGEPGGSYFPDYQTMPGVMSDIISSDYSRVDAEYDIYYYNFMGHSGRYTYNKYGEPVMLGVNNLKVTSSNTIVDAQGVTYIFGQGDPFPSWGSTNDTWYLTQIIHPVSKDTIKVTYKRFTSTIYRASEGKMSRYDRFRHQNKSGQHPTIPNIEFNSLCEPSYTGMARPNQIDATGAVLIDKVISGTDTIKFYHDTSRADVYKIKLDSILAVQKNKVVQRIRFAYTYNSLTGSALDKKMLLSTVHINDQPPYTFGYYDSYNGKKMPGIFGKGEDFWGFYNGEDYPEKPDGNEGPPRVKALVDGQTYFGWNSGHRNADYRYGQLGSLKSIAYPTGGRTELEYEGNDYSDSYNGGNPEDDYTIALQFDSVRVNGLSKQITGYDYSSGLGNPVIRSREVILHQNQTVTISSKLGLSSAVANITDYSNIFYNYGNGFEAKVRLYKYNNGTSAFDLVEEHAYNPVTLMGTPADNTAFLAAKLNYGSLAESHTLALTEGRYKIEAEFEMDAQGLEAELLVTNVMKYRRHLYGEGVYATYVYNAGGIRIKKIKFISPVNSSSYEKTYSYADGVKSSGWLVSPMANLTASMYWGENRDPGGYICPQVCNFLEFYYDSLIPLGNGQGGAIGYSKVTETMGDGRKKDMFYSMALDDYMGHYLNYIPTLDHISQDNSDLRGLLLYEELSNSSNQKVQSTSYSYSSGKAFIARNMFAPIRDIPFENCYFLGVNYDNWGQEFHFYNTQQTKVVPLATTVKDFNGTDSATRITKHRYNYWNSAFPSSTTNINSIGDSTVSGFKYAYDLNAGIYASLTNMNIISQPIETYIQKYIAGVPKVSDAELVTFRSGVYAPDTVFRIENAAPLANFVPLYLSGSNFVRDSRYQRKLTFHAFIHGNAVEQSSDTEEKEVLLWGYQHRFIVARVISSSYAAVLALIDTAIVNNPSSDVALRTELAKIRTGLGSTNPKAKVTTYTYASLQEVTSKTDSRGETTYYEYDRYGRLKRRKDAGGDSKENIWYNYQH